MTHKEVFVMLSFLLCLVMVCYKVFHVDVLDLQSGFTLDTHGWKRLQREVSDTDNYPRWDVGKVFAVYDGDTVQLGSNIYFATKHSLTGIDAPDTGEEAKISQHALGDKVRDKEVRYHLDRKRGDVLYVTLFVDGENVNQWMLDNGYAEAE